MASPGFTHHLNDLLGQFSRLATLMRSPATALDTPASQTHVLQPGVAAKPAGPVAVCPQMIMRQVGWRLGDEAFFHRVDVMRRYRWDLPLLCVDEVLLGAILTELVRTAIISSGRNGAVICALHYDDHGLRFSISDSSGATGQDVNWWEGCNRYRTLGRLEQDAARLGGRQLISVFAGEGVVVELLFPKALCLGPACLTRHVAAVNEPHLSVTAQIQDSYHPRRP